MSPSPDVAYLGKDCFLHYSYVYGPGWGESSGAETEVCTTSASSSPVFRNDNILEGAGQVGGENPLEYHPFIFIVSK